MQGRVPDTVSFGLVLCEAEGLDLPHILVNFGQVVFAVKITLRLWCMLHGCSLKVGFGGCHDVNLQQARRIAKLNISRHTVRRSASRDV